MSENIEKIEIEEEPFLEKPKENSSSGFEVEKINENNEPIKEELLRKINTRGAETDIRLENSKDFKSGQEKVTSQLVKEYFSLGKEKTIKKARKLGAYFLDMFHDGLTKKNKNDIR